ncbi:MAG: hypothetical protein KatS3mg003_0176 [Candidatus Nitrosocaldaceae archaeon]|nr:MAG: hypothetical protein KatS3mg003_0176 [Candidatus Nitrosocaldaceae archaeon]
MFDLIFYIDNGIGPVTVTSIIVETPSGTICNYDTLLLTIDIGGYLTITYTDQFTSCDTNEAGAYTAIINTKIGYNYNSILYII